MTSTVTNQVVGHRPIRLRAGVHPGDARGQPGGGPDPPRALGTTVDAYAAHLVVALCGLLGVFAVAAIGRRLLGSWSWGLVMAASLMAILMWPGLSMFDIKDVPAATGYTLVTWGLVELLFQQNPGGWRHTAGSPPS